MHALVLCCLNAILLCRSTVLVQDIATAPADTFVETPGGKIWYDVHGSGPWLVLLHDGLIPSETWDEQVPEFSRHFRTVRYDRPSYGRSEPPKEPQTSVE